ncbi:MULTISPECIES: bifunctional phosphopantothenoylcysteine decarboxylase/phosphopantothenate--cysteine ligase CoaBC [unclassified Frondihabitans]|uniref:bifunctional phosphopantothenoylcysteine decarboxylase/phosphopantothenate--cysteine ligase CoaBC n=1 Tax=unclassified Frondihabitans TaxID=2626248 RepID=UPI000F4DA1CE|nr:MULTISPECIES: bifunctional phosphopantothenoylcysteine decarboxylase/phosphopantothenate--cysteine ligase CoaBC [unclassified Frondihabitans]
MNIVVGLTGGIAAYKAVGVARLLVKAGHDVHIVPTEAALRFVGLPTLEALSRNPVTVSLYDDVAAVRHVALGQAADLVIVAPATANTLAKLAAGLADDLLGTTILASRAPLVVAPAMHTEMWLNAATRANVATLRSRGVTFVGPESGALTGADAGEGRMSEPEAIVAAALAAFQESTATPQDEPRARDLEGVRVVVSAGGTREPLDPVRFLGNRSSGKQGVALARAAADRGAEVTLVAAHLDPDVDTTGLDTVAVTTASEMALAVESIAEVSDLIVMAAAVADYRPATVSESKIKKDDHGDDLTLQLVRNPDVLAGLAANRRPGQLIVGFAAETAPDRESLLELGRTKAARKKADLLVVNAVGWAAGFGTDDNAILMLTPDGSIKAEASGSKREVADALIDQVVELRAAAD